MTLEISDK